MRFLGPLLCLGILISVCNESAQAQCVAPDMATSAAVPPALRVPLVVPEGTPLRVALPERVRVAKPGEPVKALVLYPVYAFDEVVIPAGSELTGKIAQIDSVTKKRRWLAIANGDFTPPRAYEVEFDALTLPDGRRMQITTEVSSGVAQVVRLVADPERQEKKSRVAKAASHAKQQVKDQVNAAKDEVNAAIAGIKSPGRWQRFKRFVAGMLPFRRQYVAAGTRFDAVLTAPLDFGVVTRTGEQLQALGSAPAEDSFLEARLAAKISSATAAPSAPVEAIVTAPLFSPDDKLVFPANSRLFGEVTQAKPARKFHRNGQLRLVFKQIELPDGLVRNLQASLAGMEVDRKAALKLDEEGNAEATDSKTRYMTTALAVAVATLAAQREVEPGEAPETNPAAQHTAGGSGMRLVGVVASLAVRSHVFSAVFGGYGAARSVYRNFLSRGRDVELPENTPIEISLGKPREPANKKGQ